MKYKEIFEYVCELYHEGYNNNEIIKQTERHFNTTLSDVYIEALEEDIAQLEKEEENEI